MAERGGPVDRPAANGAAADGGMVDGPAIDRPLGDERTVDAAVAELVRTLRPQVGRDWSVRAGPLDWSCWTTVAHVAHDLLAYAGQVAGRPADGYLPFDLAVKPEASPTDLLQIVAACGGLLSSAIATAGPDERAWHYGRCDRTGFAAMGAAEVVLHTWDVTSGLGVDWSPPDNLCAAVLRRLFPDAPTGAAGPVLLWCTGRVDRPGHPRPTSWVWRAALD